MFDRKKCKEDAKAMFKANQKVSILTTLIYYAIVIVLSIPLAVFEIFLGLSEQSGNFAGPFIGFLVSLVVFLVVISLFSMALLIYYYNVKKGSAKTLKDFWSCLKGKSILVTLYLIARLLPWALLMYVPYMGIVVPVMFVENMNLVSVIVMLVSLVLFIFLSIVYVQKSIAYSCVEYEFADKPEVSIRESFKKAYEYSKGNKMALFVLSLSFLGWELLSLLTFGLLYLYVQPYMYYSFINAWDEIRANKDGNKIEAEKAPEALPENTEE